MDRCRCTGRKLIAMGSLLAVIGMFTGCSLTDAVQNEFPKKRELSVKPGGEIVRIEYETVHGSARGEDFFIDVSEKGIAKARYFSQEDRNYHTLENKSLENGQWQELKEVAYSFSEALKEIPQKNDTEKAEADPEDETEMLDGPNYTNYWLTWEKDGVQRRVEYYSPQNERMRTLRTLLDEAADPQGREIVYYEAKKINGLWFRNESKLNRFSYQFTQNKNGSFFFCFYSGKKQERAEPAEKDWEAFYKFCEELELDLYETASDEGGYQCTLYYSDNTQRRIQLDKDAAKKLIKFFEDYVEKYRS